ncbi:MAG: HlyD family efflux transporter periplasmic adaptor subunit [Oscillospiraceae bacterium]|nr:HlyD family efflux transporter periplasmic adaptor subunit [Oscillospiraceae bacterium]
MDKTHKKQRKRYLLWALAAVLVLILAVMPMLASGADTSDGPVASLLSTQAERRNIDSQIIGGGQLSGEAAVSVELPENVKLTGYLVGNGDTVSEGDPIAQVDKVSVMTAITQVQETLDYLAEEIADAAGDEAADTVKALAGGTVKAVYAREGEAVLDVMLRDGALAVLSLDGLMAVQVERGTGLTAGETVSVNLSDGTEVEGTVVSNLEGVLTVTIEDDDYAIGEKVSLTDEDGGRIGSGELYIYSPWKAVAYSGTVSDILVSEGDTVYSGRTLMQLSDTGATARYQQLIDQRQEYEELMGQLFQMYRTGTLTAPCAGIVSGIDESGAYMLSAVEETAAVQTVNLTARSTDGPRVVFLSAVEFPVETQPAEEAPPAEPSQPVEPSQPEETEGDTLYFGCLAKVVEVEQGTMKVLQTPYSYTVTDPGKLPEVTLDTDAMTEEKLYTDDRIDPEKVKAEDILMLVLDVEGNLIAFDTPKEKPSMNNPGNTQAPNTGTMPSMGGMSGFTGGAAVEETFEPYSLETLTVASVTSQEHMTVEITVDELDIGLLYPGQEAVVTVDALTGQQFPAAITAIGSSGTNSGGSSKFTVELTLEKSGDMLPGMRACAYVTVATSSDVLCVPVAALEEKGTETVVYTGCDEESGTLTNPVPVTVGTSDGEYAQILEGLTEGQTVWYAYYDTLVISNAVESGGLPFRR